MLETHSAIDTRVSPAILNEATNVLAGMGLSVSDALDMMLNSVAQNKYFPFVEDHIPNELTRQTIEKAERGEEVCRAKNLQDLMAQLRA